ncbi:MAG: alpha/beta hydrolase [Planctomycetota bacterium]
MLVVPASVTGCMERLFFYPTRGPTPVRPGTEPVRMTSADGTPLFGWFVPSRSDRVDRAPTILHVHGNAGNIESHFWFTEYLPAAGFNLFIFDFRGYGESGGHARRRRPLIKDTHAALDALLARDDVDPARIGLYGQSLGGAIGLSVMAERPEIAAAVIESAFASWRDMAANALGGDRTVDDPAPARGRKPQHAARQPSGDRGSRRRLLPGAPRRPEPFRAGIAEVKLAQNAANRSSIEGTL